MVMTLTFFPVFPTESATLRVYDDIHLGVWNPNRTNWQGTTYLCMWDEAQQTPFRIMASGQNDSRRQFNLGNDIGSRVKYQLTWQFGKSMKRRERLSPGKASKNALDVSSAAGCPGGPTAMIRIKVDKRSLDAAPTGIYTDTIIFMLSPL